jgi:hypothetical protein
MRHAILVLGLAACGGGKGAPTDGGALGSAVDGAVADGAVADGATPDGSARTTGLLLDDDFEDRATGAVGLTAPWTGKGYVDGDFTKMTIQARTAMNTALLDDARVPAGKERFVQVEYDASEDAGRVVFEWPNSSNVRSLWVSFYEYRPTGANRGGEKWVRVGNTLENGNRGHDIIFCLGADDGLVVISNSANMYQFSDVGLPNFTWDGSLEHWEFNVVLSNDTAADGSVAVYRDGTLIASASGIQMNRDATDAARNFTLAELGGWSSTGGGSEPDTKYPITRVIPEWRVAATRQGVWAIQ